MKFIIKIFNNILIMTELIIHINDFNFKVIKEKLINSSLYFKNMFCNEFKENNSVEITLYDINIDNFDILKFIFDYLQLSTKCIENNTNYMTNSNDLYRLVNCKYIDIIYSTLDYFCCNEAYMKVFNKIVKLKYEYNNYEYNIETILVSHRMMNIYSFIDLNKICYYINKNTDDNFYYQLKNNDILNNNTLELSEKLYLFKKWRSCVINDNDQLLLNTYDFYDYMKYENPNIEKIYFYNDTFLQFKEDDYVIVENINIFKQNLCNFSFNIINENFNWTNIILSGGATLKCLSPLNYDINEHSDIDIYIYGEEENDKKNTLIDLLNYFNSLYNDIYYVVNGCVITLCIHGINRNFQIIYTDYLKKSDIILNFDLDYVQMLFDGENIYSTYDNLISLKYQTTKFMKPTTLMRIIKAYKKGFSFYDKSDFIDIELLNNNNMFNINKKINKYYYPNNSISKEREIFFIQLIFNTKFVYTDLNNLITNFKYKGMKNQEYRNLNNDLHQNDLINKIKIVDTINFIRYKNKHNFTLIKCIKSFNNTRYWFYRFDNFDYIIKTPILTIKYNCDININNDIRFNILMFNISNNNNFSSLLYKIYNFFNDYCKDNDIYHEDYSKINNLNFYDNKVDFKIKINYLTRIINYTKDNETLKNIQNYRVFFNLRISGVYYSHSRYGYYIQLIANDATFYSP